MNWQSGFNSLETKIADHFVFECFSVKPHKCQIYEQPIKFITDLVNRMAVIAINVREMLGVFPNVSLSLYRKHETCFQMADAILGMYIKFIPVTKIFSILSSIILRLILGGKNAY